MIGLCAFEPRDAHRVASWMDSLEALITWSGNAGFTWPFDPGQLTDFQAANPSCRFHIAIDSDGQPVGQFRLRTEPSRQSVRLGMVLVSPEARGQGHGEAMLEAALGQAFADLAVQRVNLGVYSHNAGAMRLYERLGFRIESVEPKATYVAGEWWASVTMSLLRDAWRPRTPTTR